MKRYEGLFILETAGKEEALKDTIDKISAEIAHAGGKVAGNARRELEKKSGRKVVTNQNCLALTQAAKKAKQLKRTTASP